ncbi:hypothetical protein BJV78DRAFT_1176191, partial [Lactifluus subvellereus]
VGMGCAPSASGSTGVADRSSGGSRNSAGLGVPSPVESVMVGGLPRAETAKVFNLVAV